MCESCLPVYASVKAHDPSVCPVKAALYCSICQISGHATMKCPERHEWHYRKPVNVEQLISPSILNHYNIQTLTKIPNVNPNHPPYIHGQAVIEVPLDKDGKNIRAVLSSNNLPCSSVKENKRVLEAFAEHIGKKVEYTEASVVQKRKLGSKSKPQ